MTVIKGPSPPPSRLIAPHSTTAEVISLGARRYPRLHLHNLGLIPHELQPILQVQIRLIHDNRTSPNSLTDYDYRKIVRQVIALESELVNEVDVLSSPPYDAHTRNASAFTSTPIQNMWMDIRSVLDRLMGNVASDGGVLERERLYALNGATSVDDDYVMADIEDETGDIQEKM
ncbi:hypothetical protein BDP27DRAFT_1421458 [Rhodocollybia butyracea]|uniref:Uncharacterized protein n=1 Tax=Rhodocollybia butyracea TaxID=206335 RepID=A0A9P5PV20_9AGAR|nr:hypothetical protein BDP27DRAFT_1421458 [Rhodocollybia butyracea]